MTMSLGYSAKAMKEKFAGCQSVLWYSEDSNEIVLVARGSGANIDEETDCGLVKNPKPFFGMNGRKIWNRINNGYEDIYDYADRMYKKLSKKYPDITEPCDVSSAWDDWCQENVIPYDCETYALIFNVSKMEQGKFIRKAMMYPDGHTFDVWPSGFSIDGQTFDDDEAEEDGGLQTTFADETPEVYDYKQLVASLAMCGVDFSGDTLSKQIAYAKQHYRVVAGVK